MRSHNKMFMRNRLIVGFVLLLLFVVLAYCISAIPFFCWRGMLYNRNHGLIKQVGFCVHLGFHDDDRLLYNKKNGSLWSWRGIVVLEFYREDFDFAKPWNFPENLKLAESLNVEEMFSTSYGQNKNLANFVAVKGPGTLWTETLNGRVKDPRKHSEMIIVIETIEPKNFWSKPGDDVSPDDVIRMFEADPGLAKNSKASIFSRWIPKFFACFNNECYSFDKIKDVEELKRLLIIPEEELLPLPNDTRCACPTVDRRLENGVSDAETGAKMNDDSDENPAKKEETKK